MRKALFAIGVVVGMSCATVGHQPDAAQVKSLGPEVTIPDSAKRLYGEPTYTTTQAGGTLLCAWSDSDGQMEANSKSVTLAFGPDGALLESAQPVVPESAPR